MIHYITGDVTTTKLRHIVHGCNAQGKMGSGVALAIRKKWPGAFTVYAEHIIKKNGPGTYCTFVNGKKVIGNLITQEFYGHDGKKYADPVWIRQSLATWCHYHTVPGDVVASVKIGCNLGGLDWESDVRQIFEDVAIANFIGFHIYELPIKGFGPSIVG